MLRNSGFSPRDWNQAPTYTSPVDAPPVVVLDFGELTRLAREEEASGSFRRTQDGTLAKAPLFVDDLPAAFYRVATSSTDFTPNHNTSERETIVVMEGVLRIVLNTGGYDRTDPESQLSIVSAGEVVELTDEAVSMQAVSLTGAASCLALAMYRDMDGQMRPDFRIQ